MRWHVLSIFLFVIDASTVLASPNDWPQFRGQDGAGLSANKEVPLEWAPGRNVAWSASIPGSGWSSPIVWGDRIFVTTAVPDKKEAEAPRGLQPNTQEYTVPDITYDWRVLCLSLKDGSVIWEKSLRVGKAKKGKHTKNSYATETPVTDGERLFVYLSQVGLLAFSLNGELLWKQDPGAFKTYLEYGTSSSPITDGKRVYLQCDNEEESFVAAYDCQTGKELWRAKRNEITSWSTPLLWKNTIRTELVTIAPKKARSYDPTTGELLWELGGMSDYTVPVPLADDRLCYIASGYLINPRNRPIFAIRPGAKGDISLPKESDSSDSIAWRNKLGGPYVPSPVIYQGRMYIVHDRPLFDCLDLANGKPIYARTRLPKGGNFTASPVSFRSKILCLTEEGLGYLVNTGDEFKVSFVNPPLDEDGLFLATPAIAGNSLLIRGAKQLHCIREPLAK